MTVFEQRASTIIYNLAAAIPEAAGVYLLPANVCPVAPLAILTAGRSIEFLDIDPKTLCMDWSLVQERVASGVAPRVAGILYVRTYGVDSDMTGPFRELKAREPRICLIDDRCASRPEPDDGLVDRQGADAVLYGTGYSKYADLDFGGFAHLGHNVSYRRRLREFASEDLKGITTLYKRHIETNIPFDSGGGFAETNPVRRYPRWLVTAPPKITWDEYFRRVYACRASADALKLSHNAVYRDIIPHHMQLPPAFQQWRFNVRVERKKDLLKRIFGAGFFASGHYSASARLFSARRFPVAERLYTEIVNLFNDFRVTDHEVRAVATIVRDHVKLS